MRSRSSRSPELSAADCPIAPHAADNSGVGDDAEAEVAPGGVAGVVRPGRHSVAVAVGVMTQVRAAPHRPGSVGVRLPAVRRPLPDVAGHVVEPVAVGPVRPDRRRAEMPVVAGVVTREVALPDVAHVPTTGPQLVAPGESRSVEAATRGVLPLGLAWQAGPGPRAVGQGVVMGDVDDGVIRAIADAGSGP